MVSSPYLLQPTWNQFPSAPEGLKQDMCRFSVIQAHTVRPSFQVQYDCGTLCQSTFASYLLTVLRPNSTASVSSEHRTTSCFLYLHCIVFIGSYCSSFAARLSRYSPAYSLVVRYLLGTESAPLSEDEDVMSPTVGSVHNAGRDCGFNVCRNPNLKPVKTKKLPSTAYNTIPYAVVWLALYVA